MLSTSRGGMARRTVCMSCWWVRWYVRFAPIRRGVRMSRLAGHMGSNFIRGYMDV